MDFDNSKLIVKLMQANYQFEPNTKASVGINTDISINKDIEFDTNGRPFVWPPAQNAENSLYTSKLDETENSIQALNDTKSIRSFKKTHNKEVKSPNLGVATKERFIIPRGLLNTKKPINPTVPKYSNTPKNRNVDILKQKNSTKVTRSSYKPVNNVSISTAAIPKLKVSSKTKDKAVPIVLLKKSKGKKGLKILLKKSKDEAVSKFLTKKSKDKEVSGFLSKKSKVNKLTVKKEESLPKSTLKKKDVKESKNVVEDKKATTTSAPKTNLSVLKSKNFQLHITKNLTQRLKAGKSLPLQAKSVEQPVPQIKSIRHPINNVLKKKTGVPIHCRNIKTEPTIETPSKKDTKSKNFVAKKNNTTRVYDNFGYCIQEGKKYNQCDGNVKKSWERAKYKANTHATFVSKKETDITTSKTCKRTKLGKPKKKGTAKKLTKCLSALQFQSINYNECDELARCVVQHTNSDDHSFGVLTESSISLSISEEIPVGKKTLTRVMTKKSGTGAFAIESNKQKMEDRQKEVTVDNQLEH